MNVLFAGGGTAGHVTPAISMASMLKKHFRNCKIAFVGRAGGEENREVEKEGYKIYTLKMQGFERRLTPKNLKALVSAFKSYKKAKRIIAEFNPDIIIGTGGYVCWPIIRAGQKSGIKTVIHESNAYPGLVTRVLSAGCDRVLLNLEGAREHLKRQDNVTVVGNPVRSTFSDLTRQRARKKLGIPLNDILIVSFGGSGGAEKLNESIIEVMKRHSVPLPRIRHIHGSGRKYYAQIQQREPGLCSGRGGCRILPYIENVPLLLTAADVAITRSGAMTLSEVAMAGVASILIPSPNVVANHQYENAKFMADCGGAILLEEKNLTPDALIEKLTLLESDAALREQLCRAISAHAPKNTEKNVVTAVKEILKT